MAIEERPERPCATCRWHGAGNKCVLRGRAVEDDGETCPPDLWDPVEEKLYNTLQACSSLACFEDAPEAQYARFQGEVLGPGCYQRTPWGV